MSGLKKFYVSPANEARVTCEACGKTRKISGIGTEHARKSVKLKCSCGAIFDALFERRKGVRKEVEFHGSYVDARSNMQDWMTVKDVSLKGVGFQTNKTPELDVGDVIVVRFRLNDLEQTLIHRSAVVRFLHKNFIGVEFDYEDSTDRALHYYVMS